MEYIHSLDREVGYHICGDTTPIIEDMVNTNVDLLSIDNIVSIEATKQKAGDRICIVGNVDPVGVIMLGTKEEVDNAMKYCFNKAYDSPCGYILATGCDIPYGTPLENMDCFMAAARKYGKYLLDGNRYR